MNKNRREIYRSIQPLQSENFDNFAQVYVEGLQAFEGRWGIGARLGPLNVVMLVPV